mmetsp:Transcript_16527/g.35817  ORF Transcript_16527/g.35817 Transcript_16527/m.35817 type:complete len:112 (-) Transcript_16527:75-410(-)
MPWTTRYAMNEFTKVSVLHGKEGRSYKYGLEFHFHQGEIAPVEAWYGLSVESQRELKHHLKLLRRWYRGRVLERRSRPADVEPPPQLPPQLSMQGPEALVARAAPDLSDLD